MGGGADSGASSSSSAPAGGSQLGNSAGSASAAANSGGTKPGESGAKEPAARGETKAEAVAKLKAKWRGADHEATPEELRRMLSDDYEHEFKLSNDRTTKKKWADIQRSVQLSEGAMARMREAADKEKAIQEALQWGSQPENIPAFLQAHLGVQNFDDFVWEHGEKMYKRMQEYEQLAKTNPVEYHRKVAADAEAKADAKRAWERQQAQQADQARQQNEARQRAEQAVGSALQQIGVRPSKANIELAEQIFREYSEVGYKLSLEDLAQLTREKYRQNVLAELDAHDGDALLELLGDERRAKLREMEVERAKGKKAEERQAAKDERKDDRSRAPAPDRREKGITERDLNRMFRVRG